MGKMSSPAHEVNSNTLATRAETCVGVHKSLNSNELRGFLEAFYKLLFQAVSELAKFQLLTINIGVSELGVN